MKRIISLIVFMISMVFVSLAIAVEIPAGIYTVGEDIPAGIYSISHTAKQFAQLTLWRKGINDISANGGQLYSDIITNDESETIGQLMLADGNTVEIAYGSLDFSKSTGINLIFDKPCLVPSGLYLVGEDIPAGVYSVSNNGGKQIFIQLWEQNKYTFINNHNFFYGSIQPGEKIGKITLEEGNMVEICYGNVLFEPFQGFTFADDNTLETDAKTEIFEKTNVPESSVYFDHPGLTAN